MSVDGMYFPTPPHSLDVTPGQFFNWILTGLNLEFSLIYTGWHTRGKEPNLPFCLLLARWRIVRFIAFLKVLALGKMQTALSRIWTCFLQG